MRYTRPMQGLAWRRWTSGRADRHAAIGTATEGRHSTRLRERTRRRTCAGPRTLAGLGGPGSLPARRPGRRPGLQTRVSSLQLQQGFSTGIAGVSRGLPVDGKAWWAGRISPASARAGWVGMQLLEWLREAVQPPGPDGPHPTERRGQHARREDAGGVEPLRPGQRHPIGCAAAEQKRLAPPASPSRVGSAVEPPGSMAACLSSRVGQRVAIGMATERSATTRRKGRTPRPTVGRGLV